MEEQIDQGLKINSLKLVSGGVKNSTKKTKNTADEAKEKFYCTSCGKEYAFQQKHFPSTSSPLYAKNNGCITICRTCLNNYYNKLVEFYGGNEEKAIERCCQIFDWYYSDEAAAMTKKTASNNSRILLYPSKINMIQIREKGRTYLDTIVQSNNGTIQSFKDLQSESDEEVKISEDVISFFGLGYTPEEYGFLEDQYNDWTTRYECNTKAQEELFKNIVTQQLVIQRAQKSSGSTREISDAKKTFQELLSSANLKPGQTNDNALADQNTFGTLIKKWENEHPIPQPEKEWEDVDGIKKYIRVWFLGHLCKMFKVKNKYSAMYDEEISKYTVEPPAYEDNEEDINSLININDKDNVEEEFYDTD